MYYTKLKDTTITAEDKFWIGDPCYVVPGDHWDSLCENWQAHDKANPDDGYHYIAEVAEESTGLCFYAWNTAYGDGTYRLFVQDKQVAGLCVDAGCLSAIPMRLLDHWREQGVIGEYEDLGHVVDAEHLNGEIVTEGGDFFWGDVRLPTAWTADEEEEEEECWEESYV